MRKNLRSKILLCVLAGGVLAANTALAASEPIFGSADNYDNTIKSVDGNSYIYNFGTDSELTITDNAFGIAIRSSYPNNSDVEKITIISPLDLNVNLNNFNNTYAGNFFGGIIIQSLDNKEIDKSSGGDVNVFVNNPSQSNNTTMTVHGVSVMANTSGNIIKIGNSNVKVEFTNSQYGAYIYGVHASGDNNKIIMGDGSIKASIINTEDTTIYPSAEATGIFADGSAIVEAGDVDVTAEAVGCSNSTNRTYSCGIYVEDFFNRYTGAYVDIGEGTIRAVAEGNNNTFAYGTYVIGKEQSLQKGNGAIETVAKGNGNLYAYSVISSGKTDLGIVDISSETIGGENAQSIGVFAYNGGEVNLEGGSISAKADNANAEVYSIYAYNNATEADKYPTTVNVNMGTKNDVVVNGAIRSFDANSLINLNLNTEESEFNGAVRDDGGSISINLANQAKWNNDGESSLNSLSVDNGIINQNASENITINNYNGNGNIYFKAEDNAVDGVLDFANTGDVTIESAGVGSVANLSVSNNTVNTLDVAKTEENLNAIANKIIYNADNSNLTGKVRLAEGLITPEASGDLLFDENNQGYVSNITGGDKVTTTMDAMKNIAATAIVAWRQEDSTLSQRLGELRESNVGQGIWARMSRGEFEYDGEYKNQYNFFQLGYDWAAGSWHYGAAVSHNDGQTTYTNGDGENRSTSLSLYGTWLGDKGHYADIVLKQGRLSNDFDIYTEAGHTSGDYDAWGSSLSGEYGMKIDLNGGWFITPQAQLTLMRIGGEDYTTNNGIKVHQESLQSAVGRIGFEVGKRISGSGSIYAKASLLHDFAGSADTYLSLNGLTNSYHQDIGDTWCEAGLGMNFKTSDNSYIYADVVKTFGGDVETSWQWNAGMRWTF